MKLILLKSDIGEIFILNKTFPKFLCRVNTMLPLDVDYIFKDLLDAREYDKVLPEIDKFLREKRKYGEI